MQNRVPFNGRQCTIVQPARSTSRIPLHDVMGALDAANVDWIFGGRIGALVKSFTDDPIQRLTATTQREYSLLTNKELTLAIQAPQTPITQQRLDCFNR